MEQHRSPFRNQNLYEIKISILGNASVGKTQLLNRYFDNKFLGSSLPTIGFDCKSQDISIKKYISDTEQKEIGVEEIITIKFWDTAGQERFRSISRAFFKGNSGFILVYDVTDKDSFNGLESWIEKIRENDDEVLMKERILVLGNKNDLHDEREISYEEGREYAEDHGFMFAEVSAKEDEEGKVRKAVRNLIDACMTNLIESARKRKHSGEIENTGEVRRLSTSYKIIDRKAQKQSKGCC